MHWSHADNPRLRDLALDNVLYAYGNEIPTVDAAYDSYYEGLNLVFGSTGVEIHLRVFDSEAKTAFMHGSCVALAFALVAELGLENPQFLVITDSMEHGWSGHVAVMVDADTAMDFHGARPVKDIVRPYGLAHVAVWTEDAVRENLVDDDYREDPLSYLEELERLVTEDFAAEIVRRHRKS